MENIKVSLNHITPLEVCSDAIRTCWDSQDKSDSDEVDVCPNCESEDIEYEGRPSGESDTAPYICNNCGYQFMDPEVVFKVGEKDKELIYRVGNKFKHSSTLEHIVVNFHISGVSRALLQELARHRIASPSVKSTRYTLGELKNQPCFEGRNYNKAWKYIVKTGDVHVDMRSLEALNKLQEVVKRGISNDKTKYCMPEAFRTELGWTINFRSLQNFLYLRTDKAALPEIRILANKIFDEIPSEYKYLLVDYVKKY